MEEDLKKIREICDLYPLPDIFNMDETSLNYKASPESSLSSQPIPGGKMNKERITANLCCNADGSQKMDPWFIGSAKNPRSFGTGKNHIEVHNLGLVWRYNKKAWMTGNIFREYIRWFNQQMTGRKTLLLLDGFSSHHAGLDLLEVQDIKLSNVRVEWSYGNHYS
jgi:DDE superfamily endonuclease